MSAFFEIENLPVSGVAVLWLARPNRRNLLDWDFWDYFGETVARIEADKKIKSVVVAAKGTDFTLGLDFKAFFAQVGPLLQDKHAGSREELRNLVLRMQSGFRQIAASSKVYIAAVHGHCIGAGLDLISACDLRLAAEDTLTSLRETRVAIVADLGSLQFLPRIIGPANTRLMAYTGRDFTAQQCQQMGLYTHLYATAEETQHAAIELATEVARQSGITLRGVKNVLNYSERHSPEEGMDYVATWNAAFIESLDLAEAVAAFFEKREPRFS